MKKEVRIHEVNPLVLKGRRDFLKISGLTLATAGLVLAGCSDDDDGPNQPPVDNQLPGVRDGIFDLGGGDLGILTYAYALEQLEADFYTRVVNANGFTSTFNSTEQVVMEDLYKHEVIHREFFKTAITAALNASSLPVSQHLLPNLSFNYGTLNFSNRDQVLATSKALEDTGVRAYNGAGRYLSNADYLLLAGKIVSVEARHASAIRSLINPDSEDFAGDDIVNSSNGLDAAANPSVIVPIAAGFITNEFTAQFLA